MLVLQRSEIVFSAGRLVQLLNLFMTRLAGPVGALGGAPHSVHFTFSVTSPSWQNETCQRGSEIAVDGRGVTPKLQT